MRRFGVMAVSTWVLLTVAVALAALDHVPSVQQQVAAVGPVIWYVFLTSLLLLMPLLSKSQQVMREFSLLAAISTVATSLDLLFVAVFSFGQFASVTLALFLSLILTASIAGCGGPFVLLPGGAAGQLGLVAFDGDHFAVGILRILEGAAGRDHRAARDDPIESHVPAVWRGGGRLGAGRRREGAGVKAPPPPAGAPRPGDRRAGRGPRGLETDMGSP